MHVRRLLLIDDDPGFQRLLEERLGPYGLQVVLPPDPGNPLGHLKDVRPALIVIAVELPDKVGYALCNKAKKGMARDIPVILTTSSVPASGFRSHRKLKVHADEYIDKRAMTEEEVVAKVDHLVGLSGTSSTHAAPPGDDLEELDMSDLVEETPFGSADPDEDDDGHSAVPHQIAHEGGVEFDPRQLGADEDDDGSFDFAEPMHMGSRDVAGSLAAFPPRPATERDGGRDGRSASLLGAPQAAATEPDADPRMAGPDLSDMNEFEADRTAVLPPYPQLFDPRGLGAAEPLALGSAAREPSGAVPQAEDEAGIEPSAPVADLDLGLDQVASLAEEEQADVSDRHDQTRVQELEREVERLRGELEQARQQPGGSPFSREREFLNLREVINKKEKLVIELNDELDAKDRQILSTKEKLRELDHIRADLDTKNLELEQSLLGANEELAELRGERKSLAEQLRRQTEALGSVRADAEQLSRLLERERAQWREERDALSRKHAAALEQLQHDLESERADAERALRDQHGADLRALKDAYEETSAEKDKGFGAALALAEVRRQEELSAAQRGAEERLQLELAEQRRRHQEELEGLRREHASDKNQLAQAHAAEVETLVRQNREARQALEDRHGEQLSRMEAEHEQAMATAEERRSGEVAEAERRRTAELAAAEERRAREVADAEERRARELSEAADARSRAEAELRERHESARSAMEGEHAQVRRELEGRLAAREQELRERGQELDQARETLSVRADTIDSQSALLDERETRIAALRQEVAELERQNAGYQEQVLRAFQKIKADETTVARAKKAMAIALTLLDDAEQAAAVEQAVGDD